MIFYLILIFTLIPILELAVLIKIGTVIGTFNTIILIIITGIIGAIMAKSQGMGVLRRLQDNLYNGIMPGEELFNGVLILIGGIVLLTPGLITDITGFLLLIPFTRDRIKKIIKRRIQTKIHYSQFY